MTGIATHLVMLQRLQLLITLKKNDTETVPRHPYTTHTPPESTVMSSNQKVFTKRTMY